MTGNDEKIKNRIEKLLRMSMSDSEHEAKIALEKALELMDKHNITKEDVYRQKLISEEYKTTYFMLPDWYVTLYHSMSEVSGCKFTWKNGSKYRGLKARARITGRERDVQNALYLVVFLEGEVKRLSKIYLNQLKQDDMFNTSYIKTLVKSYKLGIITNIYKRLKKEKDAFFNKEATGTSLVCVDLQTRLNEANEFLKQLIKDINTVSSKAKYEHEAMNLGYQDGEKISINQAVNGQNTVKGIGYAN